MHLISILVRALRGCSLNAGSLLIEFMQLIEANRLKTAHLIKRLAISACRELTIYGALDLADIEGTMPAHCCRTDCR